MVTRNYSIQDLPYSRLLSVPDDDSEREFLTLEELKPHHLTDLGGQSELNQNQQLTDDFNQGLQLNNNLEEQEYNVYYDLTAQQPK